MLVCTRPFDQIILLLFYFVSDGGLHETISSSIIFIVFFVSYIHMRFFCGTKILVLVTCELFLTIYKIFYLHVVPYFFPDHIISYLGNIIYTRSSRDVISVSALSSKASFQNLLKCLLPLSQAINTIFLLLSFKSNSRT